MKHAHWPGGFGLYCTSNQGGDSAVQQTQVLDNSYHRWAAEMETERLKMHHWRKSSQWAVVRRDHAQIIADDEDVAEVFTKHCYQEWRGNVWRDCYSDEHYLGTLLASKV